jgi:hypothetical protein
LRKTAGDVTRSAGWQPALGVMEMGAPGEGTRPTKARHAVLWAASPDAALDSHCRLRPLTRRWSYAGSRLDGSSLISWIRLKISIEVRWSEIDFPHIRLD